MVVQLLRPGSLRQTSVDDAPRVPHHREATRPSTSSIHPPNRRTVKRAEPTSALQLAHDLADSASPDYALIVKLAELTATQLPQGPLAERLQLLFALSKLFENDIDLSDATKSIVEVILTEIRPLFFALAPTLRWTALAALGTILERPCFSETTRQFATGQLCALLAQAIENAAPQDKAVVYSMLAEMTRCGYVSTRNSNRLLAGAAQHLRLASRNKNTRVLRQLLEQYIGLLESRLAMSASMVAQIQTIISEFAPVVADTYDEISRDFFLRSVRRALI